MVSAIQPSPFHPHTPSSLPQRKKMSITQTYFLAHKARAKLSHEAAQPDHNLRLLVGHANLLDSLMVDLAEAEREQESWFNQSVRGASAKTEERHVQWADEVAVEDDWEADSSDSDSDSTDEEDEDEDVEMADVLPLRRIPSHSVAMPPSPQLHTIMDEDEDGFEEDDEEDYGDLSLTRTSSRSVTSPPELEHDSDSSEDESMPPSPPTASIPTFTQKQKETTVQYYDSRQDEEEDSKAEFYSEGYYLPPRNPARIVSTISVY